VSETRERQGNVWGKRKGEKGTGKERLSGSIAGEPKGVRNRNSDCGKSRKQDPKLGRTAESGKGVFSGKKKTPPIDYKSRNPQKSPVGEGSQKKKNRIVFDTHVFKRPKVHPQKKAAPGRRSQSGRGFFEPMPGATKSSHKPWQRKKTYQYIMVTGGNQGAANGGCQKIRIAGCNLRKKKKNRTAERKHRPTTGPKRDYGRKGIQSGKKKKKNEGGNSEKRNLGQPI